MPTVAALKSWVELCRMVSVVSHRYPKLQPFEVWCLEVLKSARIWFPWYIITVWMYYYMFYHFNKLCVCVFICILYTCTSTSYTYLYIPHEGPFGPAEAGWCHSRNKHRGRLSQLQWKWCSHLGGRYPIDEAGRWTDDTRNFMKLLLLLKLHTSTEQSDLTGMSTSPTIETLIIKFKMLI